jgi:hypothetical protein
MTIQKALQLSVCTLALGAAANMSVSRAQGQSPFTIRKPLDGSSVREKVRIEIPRASIGSGGFVAIYVDGKFALALAPQETEDGKPFTYLWDTKSEKISDGEHAIRAVLFEPSGNTGAAEKGSSEVKVNVANIIHDGPSSLLLRYKYTEGVNRDYAREGKSFIVGGVSETGTTTSNQNLADVKSKIHYDIQDVSFDRDRGMEIALVRNKLTELSILQNGTETTLDPGQLSNSVYQELGTTGKAFFELGTAAGLAEFMLLGLPVNNTLELPELPTARVQIGDTWATENQRIDIPGMPQALQPRVKIDNKLVDLEWQDGYPTARIHQSYKNTPPGVKVVVFGPAEISNPVISFDRDIYVAYNSGVLVKTMRSLTVAGRSTFIPGGPSPSSGGGYPGGAPGFSGAGGSPYGSSGGRAGSEEGGSPGMKGGGAGGFPSSSGGFPSSAGGSPGAGGRRGGSFPGSGGGFPGSGGSFPGSGGGYPNSGARGGGSAPAPRSLRDILGAANGGNAGNNGGGEPTEHAITIKAVTDTTLVSNTGGQSSMTRTASLKTTKKMSKANRKHR